MNDTTLSQLEENSNLNLSEIFPENPDRLTRKQLAANSVREEIAKLEEAGKILNLTNEEIRLLRSFRKFKLLTKKSGEVFKWQTSPLIDHSIITLQDEAIHILDPQEV